MRTSGNNASFTRVLKKSLSILLSLVFSFSFLMAGGCTEKAVIEDYPEMSSPSTSDTDDETQEEAPDSSENAPLVEFDSLFSEGRFIYNPEAINPTYKKELENKPLTVSIAKTIMNAVYNLDTEFVLTGDEKDIHEFEKGFKLACWSSPLVNCVDITTDDYETFTIVYFPEYSDDGSAEGNVEEAKAKFEEYEDFVEGLINDNITDTDNYMQRAEKIYKALIEEIDIEHDLENLDIAVFQTNPMEETVAGLNFAFVDVVNTKKLTMWEFVQLYSFFLTELNVEHITIFGGGTAYNEQECEIINDYMIKLKGTWVWTLVTDGDNVYNCDILMDEMALEEQRKGKEDYESDMIYFGMSDKTRKESIIFTNRRYAMTMNQAQQTQSANLPTCQEDY